MNETAISEKQKDSAADQQILTFQLKGSLFGVEILKVKELLEFSGLTKVPMVPDYIRGVINLRGSVVQVVDLSELFNRKPTEISRRTCIIIVEHTNTEKEEQNTEYTGILVDSVNEVVDLKSGDIEPPPSFGTGLSTDFILGMAKIDGKIVILLNIDHLLSYDRLADMAQVDFQSLQAAAAV